MVGFLLASFQVGLPVVMMLLAAGCSPEKPPAPAIQEFRLRGRVESIDPDKKRAVIAHENIDGYMKAMTMPFAVPDVEALKLLRSGDQIEARLIRDSRTNLSWLENIVRIGVPATTATPGPSPQSPQ